MKNNLDNAFNITPTEVEVDESDVVVGVDREKPDRLAKDDITKDYEYTRGNLYSIIEKGQELIKSVSDATDKLMDLQKKLKDVEEDSPQKGPNTVNNALFVGSTAELAKLLKNGVKEQNK